MSKKVDVNELIQDLHKSFPALNDEDLIIDDVDQYFVNKFRSVPVDVQTLWLGKVGLKILVHALTSTDQEFDDLERTILTYSGRAMGLREIEIGLLIDAIHAQAKFPIQTIPD